MTRALADSGRHELAIYSGPSFGAEYLKRWGLSFQQTGDLEEVLADPSVDAVIVAGNPASRPGQLRRTLQSERHVLCVHPAAPTPDAAYEALLIQGDTGRVLQPLLAEMFHPAVRRLADMIALPLAPAARNGQSSPGAPVAATSTLRLVELERAATEHALLQSEAPDDKPALPGWDVLRRLGGEIAEVVGLSSGEEIAHDEPLLIAGRFQLGGLFQVSLLPQQPAPVWRLTVVLQQGRAELTFPEGWPGPARLAWHDETGAAREETWETWNPWPTLVEVFEAAVADQEGRPRTVIAASPGHASQAIQARKAAHPPRGRSTAAAAFDVLSWTDEVRCLELDDAARRSVERRRASTLEYQTATEEASFKGAMTLVGCAMLWASLVLFGLSYWLPWLGWVIAPALVLFLVLQLLRWAIPSQPGTAAAATGAASPAETDQERVARPG
jgi:hypothetical protein